MMLLFGGGCRVSFFGSVISLIVLTNSFGPSYSLSSFFPSKSSGVVVPTTISAFTENGGKLPALLLFPQSWLQAASETRLLRADVTAAGTVDLRHSGSARFRRNGIARSSNNNTFNDFSFKIRDNKKTIVVVDDEQLLRRRETRPLKQANSFSNATDMDSAGAVPFPLQQQSVNRWKQLTLRLPGKGGIKQYIQKMGISPVLVYNLVSQINTGTTMSIACYFYSSRMGLSPLSAGQWKGFLAFYTPFLVVNNLTRPLRLAAAVAWSHKLDRLVIYVQQKLNWGNQNNQTPPQFLTLATAAVLYAVAVGYSATCLFLASTLAGVPLFEVLPSPTWWPQSSMGVL